MWIIYVKLTSEMQISVNILQEQVNDFIMTVRKCERKWNTQIADN